MYIKFQDDPVAKRFNNAYANLCDGDPTKETLKLVNQCFSIFKKSQTIASFCDLSDFIYPVDGHQLIDFEVCAGETLSIFDNQTDLILPTDPNGLVPNYPLGKPGEYIPISDNYGNPAYFILPNDRNYVRGCILYVRYPISDKNGDEVLPSDGSCLIKVTDRQLTEMSMPLQQFYSHFANPSARDANKLINKLDIVNPNPTFSIKVSGLIVYVKSNDDPSDCAC